VPPTELEGRARKKYWEGRPVGVVDVDCIGPAHIGARSVGACVDC